MKTNEELQTAVEKALTRNGTFNSNDISVKVNGSNVTLIGNV